MNYEHYALRDVVDPRPGTRNPAVSGASVFSYVDLDAVDRDLKSITAPKRVVGDEAPSRARKVIRTNDVLVALVRPNLNAVALVPADLDNEIASTGFCVLRATARVLPEYLFYFVRSRRFVANLSGVVSGAMYPAVTEGQVLNQKVLLPPVDEQRRIVDLLSRAENIVRMRREAEAKAKEITPALFLEMFGDPATNPKKWDVARIGEVATRVTKGESPKWQGFGYVAEGVRFVTSENVRWGELDVEKGKYIAPEFHHKLRRSALFNEDVLVNLVGASVGRAACVSGDVLPANINQAVAVVTVDRRRCLPRYLLSHLLSAATQQSLLGQAVEGARANISLSNIRDLQIMLPPSEAQEQLVERLQSLSRLRLMLARTAFLAEGAFQSLLAGVFREDGQQ